MRHLRLNQFLKAVFVNLLLMALIFMGAVWDLVHPADEVARNDLRSAIGRVAKQNTPAVVHIEASRPYEMKESFMPSYDDSFFRYSSRLLRMHHKFRKESCREGTGMLIDSQGHILTSNQAIAGAGAILVWLDGDRKYPAKLLGADPETDLAVICISSNETFPHVTFGDSDKVEVGDWVVAIGRPGSHNHKVTQGIICAKHRSGITNPNSYRDFLQTNASINQDNSGGPLVNLCGEVIGVNSTVMSQSAGYEGVCLAIPSNMASHIAKRLMTYGKVERGWLGADIQDLTPNLRKSLGWKRAMGALITQVAEGGPADLAGMKKGDIVIRYRDNDILNASALMNEVSNSPVGQEMNVTVYRHGMQQTLTLRIGSFVQARGTQASVIKARLGVEMRPMTSQEMKRYRVSSDQGLAIASVAPDSPLVGTGFEVNDIILEINGRPIRSTEEFMDIMNPLRPEQRIILRGLDHRSGRSGYVQVVLP